MVHIHMSNIALDAETRIVAKEMIEGADEKVYCSVNSSKSCSHTWKWIDGVGLREEVASYRSTLTVRKLGWYKCDSECNIRGKRCTVLTKLVHVIAQKGKNVSYARCLSNA